MPATPTVFRRRPRACCPPVLSEEARSSKCTWPTVGSREPACDSVTRRVRSTCTVPRPPAPAHRMQVVFRCRGQPIDGGAGMRRAKERPIFD